MYTSEYMMVQSAALYAQPKAEGGYCPAYDTRLIRDVWMYGCGADKPKNG